MKERVRMCHKIFSSLVNRNVHCNVHPQIEKGMSVLNQTHPYLNICKYLRREENM